MFCFTNLRIRRFSTTAALQAMQLIVRPRTLLRLVRALSSGITRFSIDLAFYPAVKISLFIIINTSIAEPPNFVHVAMKPVLKTSDSDEASPDETLTSILRRMKKGCNNIV